MPYSDGSFTFWDEDITDHLNSNTNASNTSRFSKHTVILACIS